MSIKAAQMCGGEMPQCFFVSRLARVELPQCGAIREAR